MNFMQVKLNNNKKHLIAVIENIDFDIIDHKKNGGDGMSNTALSILNQRKQEAQEKLYGVNAAIREYEELDDLCSGLANL